MSDRQLANRGLQRVPTEDYNHYRFVEGATPGFQGEDPDSILNLAHSTLNFATLSNKFQERQEQSRNSNRPSRKKCRRIQTIYLQHNSLLAIPDSISNFIKLKILDLSNNTLTQFPESILKLTNLTALIVRNNNFHDHSLPKNFGLLSQIETLNFSGNYFTFIPPQVLELTSLKALFFGGNQIEALTKNIAELTNLEMLYLGGNRLTEIPTQVGLLHNLQALVLCENQLQSLPSTISSLHRLRSLALHKNLIATLPPEIVKLSSLSELSLRDNPLVVRFVKEMTYMPPSLLELSARTIKIAKVKYSSEDIPQCLKIYLETAQRCVNPRCKGVYFDSRIEHIKFVDFCGKYRLPLLEYLCTPNCTEVPAVLCSDNDSSDEDTEDHYNRLRRVLLG